MAALVLVAFTVGAAAQPTGEALTPAEPQSVEQVEVGDAEAGRATIQRLGCGVCHRIPGIQGAIGIVGPPLDGISDRPLIAGVLANQPTVLVRFILDPPSLVPNTAMPAIPQTEQEARDIAAYLATLR